MLHEKLEDYAQTTPDRLALIYGDNRVSYAELWRTASRFGAWLASELDSRSRVAICLENSPELVGSVYGVVLAGMIAVPLDANIQELSLFDVLSDCRPKALVTTRTRLERLLPVVKALDLELIVLCDDAGSVDDITGTDVRVRYIEWIVSAQREDGTRHDLSETDTCIILYTTGTTGPKKGVCLSHTNLQAATASISQFMGMREKDGIVESLPMPISHSFGLARLRCVIELGGTALLENGLIRTDRVLRNIEKYGVNSFGSVAGGFEILFRDVFRESFRGVGPKLKFVEIGSAPLRLEIKKWILECCPNARVCMHYGLTEASRATFLDLRSGHNYLRTVGKPSPNVTVRIGDETGKRVSSGGVGEILVRGDVVAQAYWNNSELTAQTFCDGWLRTGDVGFLDQDGHVNLVGRVDDMINVGGSKVAPTEVEDVIAQHPDILEAAVVGEMDHRSGSMVVRAYVVLGNRDDFGEFADVKRFCSSRLERHKVPKQFKVVDRLPKTSSGKIQRRQLREESGRES